MIPLPQKPKVIKKEKDKAVFEMEALYPGYGVTIGNSLRRVLLSSLEGAAVTKVKIRNVSHEFSTIPGVYEDTISILLNLKQLRFKIFSQEPQKAVLKTKGEGKVTGADFKLPTQLELVNKDAHIAALTEKKAELEIEIEVEKGVGYEPKEAKKKAKLEVGVILLDAIFTPVRRISFRVENMRVGKRTDFDRLFLEIETDGTITPEQAFYRASEVLLSHFELLTQTYKDEAEKEQKKVTDEPKEKKTKKKHEKKKKRKKTKS